MKTNFLTKIVMAVVFCSAVSCKKDLLNQAPYGVQTDVSYFKTSDDLNKTLMAAYSYLNLQGFPPFEATLWAIGDVGSDDAFKGGGPASNTPAIFDLAYGQQRPTSNIVSIFWTQSYSIIAACNLVIDKQSVVSGDANEIKKMVNQAKFLRAYCYYNLVTNFGDVPMPLTYLDPTKVDFPRSSKSTVWAQIEKDLTEASSLPTKNQWGASNDGKATSGAALALLGKAYMFQKKYAEAEATLKKVIDEGTYSLVPDYGSIFRKATGDYNSPESIFDIKHKTKQGGITDGEGNFNFTFVMPSDGAVGGFGYLEPSQDLVSEFEKGDPRAIYSIIFRGDVFPTATSTYTVNNTTSASGRANRKLFITPLERSALAIFDEGKSNHLIRYAEVLLLYAEALNENGKVAEAQTWLNKVRQRARTTAGNDPQRISTAFDLSYTGTLLPDVTATDKTGLRNAIWHEQRVELAMEGHRREYLVRTGRLTQRMAVAKNIAVMDESKYSLLPIPQSDVDLSNGQIKQNDGY